MTGFRRWSAAALVLAWVGLVTGGDARAQSQGTTSTAIAEQDDATTPSRTEWWELRPVVRVGHDLVLGEQSEVRDVLVVLGNAEIRGRVARDVFVWFGDVRLAPTARIDGSLVVIAGDVTVPGEAVIDDDMAVIGGRISGSPDYRPGRELILIGPPAVGDAARSVVPWVTRGLLLGRPIVPWLGWVWIVVLIFLALSVALTLVFSRAVESSAAVVLQKPLRTFLTGLVVLIVTGPLLAIFAATVVGIVVMPVVIFGLFIAWTMGKVGVTRGIGQRVVFESDTSSRFQAVRSVVIGFVLLTLAYMVPVLGIITWSLVSVFGLGAATIAVMAALREEYPRKPRKAKKGNVDEAPPDVPPDPAGPEPETDLSRGGAGGPASALLREDATRSGEAVPPAPPPARPDAPPPDGLGPRAQFLERTAAFALDCVLVAIVDLLLDSRQDGMYFILLVSYHIAFWTWQGTTLGGIIVGLRVIRTDGQPLRFVDALVRGLSSLFSFAVLGIGCLWMLHDPERQTWHDMIAGTYVIKVPREWVLSSTPPMDGVGKAGS